MATTRKSDFTGDLIGDWEVVSRADATDGKRRWNVENGVTGEQKAVFQTELKSLLDKGVGPGQCKHDVFVNNCTECGALLGDKLPARPVAPGGPEDVVPTMIYEPRGEFAESAMICADAMDWTRGLPVEIPDEYVLDETDVEIDIVKVTIEARKVRETEALAAIEMTPDEIVKHTGIGESTPETVTEAGLDDAAAELPKDPMRKAIRDVFDVTVDLRNEMLAIAGELEAYCQQAHDRIAWLQMRYDQLMERLDAALKVAITR